MKYSSPITALVLAAIIPLVLLGATSVTKLPTAYALEGKPQINVAEADNVAVQVNVCGNYGIVKEKSDVSCSNQVDQSNQVAQTQAADPNGDGGSNTQLNYASA